MEKRADVWEHSGQEEQTVTEAEKPGGCGICNTKGRKCFRKEGGVNCKTVRVR